ncbi:MAG TPA: SH3 domain-containing protein [Gemmatimonadaceae bacterium]|nr:SH3 domain-containing protein [Gemmatimonadaceae bacterium]
MRHLYVNVHQNGGGFVPCVSDSTMVRNETIGRAVRVVFAALAVAAAIPSGVPLGAQAATRAKSPAPSPTSAAAAAAAAAAPAVSNDSYNLAVPSVLRDAPSSAAIGQLQKTTNVEVIARDRGWSRVRIEGWVPDSVLVPADTAFRANLSAADLRADPVGTRGKMVMWNVEFLALQTADPLRHGLADEEPYILARGPNSENALLYLVVPPSLMGTARALQPLARITVTARVRDGRSDPVGIPILDIQTLRRIR